MSNELKDCPFCGGKPEMYYPFHLMGNPGSAAKYRAGVRCPQCRCESRATTPPDEAITSWNTRTEHMSTAALDVLVERERQMSTEGWTTAHDDEHAEREMAEAAAAYALHASRRNYVCLDVWPWSPSWWKPTTPRRDLIKAGALILAEIERLDRAARKAESERSGGDDA